MPGIKTSPPDRLHQPPRTAVATPSPLRNVTLQSDVQQPNDPITLRRMGREANRIPLNQAISNVLNTSEDVDLFQNVTAITTTRSRRHSRTAPSNQHRPSLNGTDSPKVPPIDRLPTKAGERQSEPAADEK